MSLSAIVPVWNGREHLERLLPTLEAQTYPASELLIVDNGSADGAPELARKRGARILPMGHNAGFARAVNHGIRESQGAWIAILNSDVELAPDYFDRLIQEQAAFATGKILMASAPDRIDATFDAVCRGGVAWRVGHGRPDGPLFSRRCEIHAAPWTAVVFRRDVFDTVGLLDETFESYLEDVDFGLRCAKSGISGVYLPEARAWHYGSAALGRWHPEMVRLIARNQRYIVAKHFPRNSWPVLVAQGLWALLAVRHGAALSWARGRDQARSLSFKETAPVSAEWLRACERMIHETQDATGWDWYWRVYFLLTALK
jgi:GT2 family glycosyltransferase